MEYDHPIIATIFASIKTYIEADWEHARPSDFELS